MVKWFVIATVAVGVPIVGFLVYHATAMGGGTTSWILAVVWTVAVVVILGALARSVAS